VQQQQLTTSLQHKAPSMGTRVQDLPAAEVSMELARRPDCSHPASRLTQQLKLSQLQLSQGSCLG